MRPIFISYRRDDAEGQAGRLYDVLVAEFGSNLVFIDVATIQPGLDFRKAIDQSVSSCGAFLSVIGKNWVNASDKYGKRRLDDPTDFVRLETVAALRRDIPVIPVLVQGASVPRPEQLPEELKDLTYRNALELTHPRWESDVQVLIQALRAALAKPRGTPIVRSGAVAAEFQPQKSYAVSDQTMKSMMVGTPDATLLAEVAACRTMVEDYTKRLDDACVEYYQNGALSRNL